MLWIDNEGLRMSVICQMKMFKKASILDCHSLESEIRTTHSSHCQDPTDYFFFHSSTSSCSDETMKHCGNVMSLFMLTRFHWPQKTPIFLHLQASTKVVLPVQVITKWLLQFRKWLFKWLRYVMTLFLNNKGNDPSGNIRFSLCFFGMHAFFKRTGIRETEKGMATHRSLISLTKLEPL